MYLILRTRLALKRLLTENIASAQKTPPRPENHSSEKTLSTVCFISIYLHTQSFIFTVLFLIFHLYIVYLLPIVKHPNLVPLYTAYCPSPPFSIITFG